MAKNSNHPTAHTELATPTDLTNKHASAVIEVLNPLVADALALYIKTKNFHWHLSGPNFRDYHLMLDEQAAQIFETIDTLAERVRKLGGTTVRSVKHVSRLTRIEDDEEDYVPAPEMLQRLQRDNEALAKAQREAIEVAEEAKDHATASILEVYLDETERRVWFLFESTRPA